MDWFSIRDVPSSEQTQGIERLLGADHEALDKLMKELLAALDHRDAETAFARLDLFWARLAMHIRGENMHLFPAIRHGLQDIAAQGNEILSSAETQEAIAQLRSDHDFFMHELAGAIKIMSDRHTEVRDDTSMIESVRQTIATLRDRLEAHNKLEEEMVYRLPAKLLGPEELSVLTGQILNELKNLPPRFRG